MLPEENKALMRRFMEEGLNKHNIALIDEYFAEGFVNHSPMLGQAPDREGLKKAFELYFESCPDLQFIIEDMIAEEDKVVLRVTTRGTNTGPLMGVPPTNRKFEFSTISIVHISNKRITERWNVQDTFGMLQQLDLISIKGMS